MLNSTAYLLNDKLQPIEGPGKIGQLFISSPNLAIGYCGGKTNVRGFIQSGVSLNMLYKHLL